MGDEKILEGFVSEHHVVSLEEAEIIQETNRSAEKDESSKLSSEETIESEDSAEGLEEDEETKQAEEVDAVNSLEEEPQVKSSSVTATSVRMNGVALKNKTHVYQGESRNSNILRSYNEGHILIFNSYKSNWYKATVYLNGVKHSGYIHADDVDVITTDQKTLNGPATTQSVAVYASPTRK